MTAYAKAPTGSVRGSETVYSGDVARPVEVAQRRIQDAMDFGLVRRVRCAPEQREQNPNAQAAFYRSLTINQITRLRSLTIHKTLSNPRCFLSIADWGLVDQALLIDQENFARLGRP